MVKLGTAVPEDDDQATLIHDLDAMGTENDLDFQSFAVSEDAAGATTSAPAPPASGTDSSSTDRRPTRPRPRPRPPRRSAPTEASAATLPLGATVGPAGLPVTPYTLTYHGGFFDMAGLFSDLDNRVKVNDAGTDPIAHGRLMTVDGFAMSADPVKGFPSVAAEIAVTTYMVPADQGIAAGATPAGPAPVGSPDAPVPVSDTATSAPAPTAAVSP